MPFSPLTCAFHCSVYNESWSFVLGPHRTTSRNGRERHGRRHANGTAQYFS